MKLKHAAFLGIAVLASHQAFAADRMATRYGNLQVDSKEPYEAMLLHNGKKIYGEGNYTISLEQKFQVGDQDVVLVGHSEGGNACPATYFFVTLKPGNKVEKSPDFGTCSDLVEVKQDAAGIMVNMPKMNGRGKAKYVYKNGVVTENGKPLKS